MLDRGSREGMNEAGACWSHPARAVSPSELQNNRAIICSTLPAALWPAGSFTTVRARRALRQIALRQIAIIRSPLRLPPLPPAGARAVFRELGGRGGVLDALGLLHPLSLKVRTEVEGGGRAGRPGAGELRMPSIDLL